MKANLYIYGLTFKTMRGGEWHMKTMCFYKVAYFD